MKRSVIAAMLAVLIAVGVASASGGPSLLHPKSLHKTAPATFLAKFTTTNGSFVVKVTRAWAPRGADRFYNLVYYHFYDNQPFYRVQQGFLAQWGISMTPAIAKAWKTAYIKDEPMIHKDGKGTIAFAHVLGVKNSRTTQVFVNLRFNNLGPSFPSFGVVTKGLSVVAGLYHGPDSVAANAHQDYLAKYGAHFVHANYPHLDWIKTARIVG